MQSAVNSFRGRSSELVQQEIYRSSIMEYPRLRPTLQTYLGMVLNDGAPRSRCFQPTGEAKVETLIDNSQDLLTKCQTLSDPKRLQAFIDTSRDRYKTCRSEVELAFSDYTPSTSVNRRLKNFMTCSSPVSRRELLDYIRSRKRIDVEQAVAMVISFFIHGAEALVDVHEDDFEHAGVPIVDELINDRGTIEMLVWACMWREPDDCLPQITPETQAREWKKQEIVALLGWETGGDLPSNIELEEKLRSVRRKRENLNNSQHLAFPKDLLADPTETSEWHLEHNYRIFRQTNTPIAEPRIVSKKLFRTIQKLLSSMGPPRIKRLAYVHDVRKFISESGMTSPPRIAALEQTSDPYSLAYGFIAAQRRWQLKVVSDLEWTRFLVKGEGALLLQNRPDVMSSFEDILVRRAFDLAALTAITCPKGIRDHFSSEVEVKARARGICELMERYVRDFGQGKMENLIFVRGTRGGKGRGPVDFYNALCDELQDCKNRANAMNINLDIGPVHKFLAKDIMAWNQSWADDAFAGGKVPGWVEYLARVKAEEINLED